MSIPRAAYPAPFNTTRASHVVLSVKDLGASRAFYVDAMGFVVSGEEKGALYLRGLEEACHHSLVLKRATGEPACERIGLRVYTEDDLEVAKSYFERAGLPAQWADIPHHGRTLHVSDAVGTPLELCATMTTMPRMVVQFQAFKGPCPHRLDHFQIITPEVQRACEFYSGMGFRLSEYIAVDNTDELVFVFLQRKGNPHDIVFAGGPGPRLHHVAFTVPDAQHIIHACDVAGSFGFGNNLEHGPARHGPGHALFAYFRDPDGHRLELFNTHYQMMDSENEPVRWNLSYMRNRPWGLPPRARWFKEASEFAGVPAQEPAKPGAPFTLEKFLLEAQ
ncbi:MAG: VOC family protein [Xanthobacteraceae bacterium]